MFKHVLKGRRERNTRKQTHTLNYKSHECNYWYLKTRNLIDLSFSLFLSCFLPSFSDEMEEEAILHPMWQDDMFHVGTGCKTTFFESILIDGKSSRISWWYKSKGRWTRKEIQVWNMILLRKRKMTKMMDQGLWEMGLHRHNWGKCFMWIKTECEHLSFSRTLIIIMPQKRSAH